MDASMEAAKVEMFINELIAAMEREIMGPEGDAFLAGLGVLAGLIVGVMAISAITFLINLVCRWRIFSKAGEKGWKSIIPFYSSYVEFSFTWSKLQGILMLATMLLGRIGCAAAESGSLVYTIGSLIGAYSAILVLIQTHKLSLSFGRKFGFTLGLIFLNPIFMLILAFGKKSQYVGPAVKNK